MKERAQKYDTFNELGVDRIKQIQTFYSDNFTAPTSHMTLWSWM